MARVVEKPKLGAVIYGSAIDRDGQPAKGIWLVAHPLGVTLLGALDRTKTDEHGKFRFEVSEWGRYTVYAEDRNAGYSSDCINVVHVKEVRLSPGHPVARFNLRLPPKSGFLKISLTNRRTGEAISGVEVTVVDPREPNSYIFGEGGGTDKDILLPPDEDLLIHVTSWDFKEWDRSAGKGWPIRIHSGDRAVLDVQLDPEK